MNNIQRKGRILAAIMKFKQICNHPDQYSGMGLNLTSANHVIHFDCWWNPAIENQATDRVFRIGQTKDVMVHKFVTTGTIEEKIDAIIEGKTKLAGDVISESTSEN